MNLKELDKRIDVIISTSFYDCEVLNKVVQANEIKKIVDRLNEIEE